MRHFLFILNYFKQHAGLKVHAVRRKNRRPMRRIARPRKNQLSPILIA